MVLESLYDLHLYREFIIDIIVSFACGRRLCVLRVLCAYVIGEIRAYKQTNKQNVYFSSF